MQNRAGVVRTTLNLFKRLGWHSGSGTDAEHVKSLGSWRWRIHDGQIRDLVEKHLCIGKSDE